MTQQDADDIVEEVVAVRDQFHREKDFAGYTVDATNALLAKIK